MTEDKAIAQVRSRPDVVEEAMRELSKQDVRAFRLSIGHRIDPGGTVRLGPDGNGGLIAVGRSEQAIAEVLERVHRAGRENRPIEVEYEVVPWDGALVAQLVDELARRVEGLVASAAKAGILPPQSQSSESEDGKR